MTYYGRKERAAVKARTVRGNKVTIAEEIPEAQLRLQADTRGAHGREEFVHIALGLSYAFHVHGNKISDMTTINFP